MTFEEYLEAHGCLFYPITGVSMRPLLRQGRDVVTVQKAEGRLAPGDVALYRRDGRYILHRVMEVRPSDYVILGDNCTAREYGITDAEVLGLMTAFVRRGRKHRVTEPGYRLYTWWMLRFPDARIALKKLYLRVRGFGGRVLRRLGLRR